MMTLDEWGVKPNAPKPRPATDEDVRPLFNSFQRVRKLAGVRARFTNVRIEWGWGDPHFPDEWALVVEIIRHSEGFIITAVPLRTDKKWLAARRAYGYGLRDKDGLVNWPYEPVGPSPDGPHVPDVDEAARFHYFRF